MCERLSYYPKNSGTCFSRPVEKEAVEAFIVIV